MPPFDNSLCDQRTLLTWSGRFGAVSCSCSLYLANGRIGVVPVFDRVRKDWFAVFVSREDCCTVGMTRLLDRVFRSPESLSDVLPGVRYFDVIS